MKKLITTVLLSTLLAPTVSAQNNYYDNVFEQLPLYEALNFINFEMPAISTKLYFAAYNGDIKETENLLLTGAYIDFEVDSIDAPRTPLMAAVMREHLTVVKHLILYGAEINFVASDGVSALDLAEASSNQKITDLLKRYGAVSGYNARKIISQK